VGCHGIDPVEPISSDESCLICHHRGERPRPRPDIPDYPAEEVTIENRYAPERGDRYGPVSFDHEEHISRLRELIEEDGSRRLASRFHHEKQFLCTACHDHGPPMAADTKPPRCTYCHQELPDPEQLGSPATPAAYHQQCVGCHERMNVQKDGKPLGCADCHPSHEEKA
jgi:hypothetical protein